MKKFRFNWTTQRVPVKLSCVFWKFMPFKYRGAPPEISDDTWTRLMQVYKGNPRHIDPFTGDILSISREMETFGLNWIETFELNRNFLGGLLNWTKKKLLGRLLDWIEKKLFRWTCWDNPSRWKCWATVCLHHQKTGNFHVSLHHQKIGYRMIGCMFNGKDK